MYKKNDIIKTVRGEACITATKNEYHIINGAHPFINNGDKWYPSNPKDYIVAFRNSSKSSSVEYIYEELTQLELELLIIK